VLEHDPDNTGSPKKVHAQLKTSNGLSLDPPLSPDNRRLPINSG
jgi:hypothetical protein